MREIDWGVGYNDLDTLIVSAKYLNHDYVARLERALPGAATLTQVVRVFVTIGTALAVLGGAAWALRIREFDQSVGMVMRRFRRSAS